MAVLTTKEKMHEYYKKNREKAIEKGKKYYLDHKEELLKKKKKRDGLKKRQRNIENCFTQDKTMEDHAIANEIYSSIVDVLIGKDIKHVKMALSKIEFNLFCVTDE